MLRTDLDWMRTHRVDGPGFFRDGRLVEVALVFETTLIHLALEVFLPGQLTPEGYLEQSSLPLVKSIGPNSMVEYDQDLNRAMLCGPEWLVSMIDAGRPWNETMLVDFAMRITGQEMWIVFDGDAQLEKPRARIVHQEPIEMVSQETLDAFASVFTLGGALGVIGALYRPEEIGDDFMPLAWSA